MGDFRQLLLRLFAPLVIVIPVLYWIFTNQEKFLCEFLLKPANLIYFSTYFSSLAIGIAIIMGFLFRMQIKHSLWVEDAELTELAKNADVYELAYLEGDKILREHKMGLYDFVKEKLIQKGYLHHNSPDDYFYRINYQKNPGMLSVLEKNLLLSYEEELKQLGIPDINDYCYQDIYGGPDLTGHKHFFLKDEVWELENRYLEKIKKLRFMTQKSNLCYKFIRDVLITVILFNLFLFVFVFMGYKDIRVWILAAMLVMQIIVFYKLLKIQDYNPNRGRYFHMIRNRAAF